MKTPPSDMFVIRHSRTSPSDSKLNLELERNTDGLPIAAVFFVDPRLEMAVQHALEVGPAAHFMRR